MKIVLAKLKDLADILAINKQLIQDIPYNYTVDAEWLEESIVDREYHLIKNNGQILGALCLQMSVQGLKKAEAYIATLAIKKDEHHKGLGRMLVGHVKRKAKKAKKTLLTVDSFCAYDCKDFYLNCGFTLKPELGEYEGLPVYHFFQLLEG